MREESNDDRNESQKRNQSNLSLNFTLACAYVIITAVYFLIQCARIDREQINASLFVLGQVSYFGTATINSGCKLPVLKKVKRRAIVYKPTGFAIATVVPSFLVTQVTFGAAFNVDAQEKGIQLKVGIFQPPLVKSRTPFYLSLLANARSRRDATIGVELSKRIYFMIGFLVLRPFILLAFKPHSVRNHTERYH